jgi:hypothetical protein
MKRGLFVIPALILFSLTFGMSEARACEPCTPEASMKFEQTARAAELIIVGQRNDFSPDELRNGVGPENIKLKIKRVLKGEESKEEITVKSWSGMCPYGVVINDNQQHIVFLKKSNETYRAVDDCSVKYYTIKEGMVEFGKERIPVEDFELKLRELGRESGHRLGLGLFSILYRISVGGEIRVC